MQQKNAGCNRDQPDHKECADHCHQPRVPLTQEILVPADPATEHRICHGAALGRDASGRQHNDQRQAAEDTPAQQIADERRRRRTLELLPLLIQQVDDGRRSRCHPATSRSLSLEARSGPTVTVLLAELLTAFLSERPDQDFSRVGALADRSAERSFPETAVMGLQEPGDIDHLTERVARAAASGRSAKSGSAVTKSNRR